MEMVFLLVWKMRQDIEFHKSRATMQALLAQKGAEPKEIKEAFDMLKEAFFPFDKNQKTDEAARMKAAMQREISRGPLEVTAMEDPNRKKVAGRLTRGDRELEQQNEMKKQGQSVNIDAFDKARHRPRGAS